MKIALFTSDLTLRHGWGMVALQLIDQLAARGLDLTIIATQDSEPQPNIPTERVLPSVVNPGYLRMPRTFLMLPRIRRLTMDADILHSTVEYFAPLATIVADGRPVFQTIHGSYAHLPRVMRWPWRMLYQRAFTQAHLVCVSRYTQRVVQQIVPAARTTVIPNGVNLQQYASIPRQPDPRPTILTVGGVKTRKGTLPLVRAIAQIRHVIPDIQCVIIGNTAAEPATTSTVQSEIERLQLQDHVRLTGFVDEDELRDWYGRAHVFVLPSVNAGWKFEGFGLVHLEASAAGLPVIGARDCGAEDAIIHGKTGLLVDQTQLETELPQAILSLLNDPQQARQMGEAGRRHAQNYTWSHAAARWLALYEAALQS